MNPPTTLTNHNPPATIGCCLNPNPIRAKSQTRLSRGLSETGRPSPGSFTQQVGFVLGDARGRTAP